jgi:hypothetical protein
MLASAIAWLSSDRGLLVVGTSLFLRVDLRQA